MKLLDTRYATITFDPRCLRDWWHLFGSLVFLGILLLRHASPQWIAAQAWLPQLDWHHIETWLPQILHGKL